MQSEMQRISDSGEEVPPESDAGVGHTFSDTGDPDSNESLTNAGAEVIGDAGGKGDPATSLAPVSDAAVPEKLADDVMRPPLWKRTLYKVIPALEKSECPALHVRSL